MIKPFLILQLRPEDAVSDNEYEAFLEYGNLEASEVRRIRMEKSGLPQLDPNDYSGIIVGGGPYCISDDQIKKSKNQTSIEFDLKKLIQKIVSNDTPYLGACYGLGVLSTVIGGEVSKEKYKEEPGAIDIFFSEHGKKDHLTKELPESFKAFGGHKESCQSVPPGAVLLASSKDCPVQMIRVGKNVYATQFHPELDSEGLELRVNTYKYLGYFKPQDAHKLIHNALQENITIPQEILGRFVKRYRSKL